MKPQGFSDTYLVPTFLPILPMLSGKKGKKNLETLEPLLWLRMCRTFIEKKKEIWKYVIFCDIKCYCFDIIQSQHFYIHKKSLFLFAIFIVFSWIEKSEKYVRIMMVFVILRLPTCIINKLVFFVLSEKDSFLHASVAVVVFKKNYFFFCNGT